MRQIFSVFLLSTLMACTGQPEQTNNITSKEIAPITLKYAKGFKVSMQDGHKLLEVPVPYKGADSGFKYLLVNKGDKVPPHDRDVQVVKVPLESIVCTSTTHIPLLDYIGETKKLVGFPTTDYISSSAMRQRIDSGKVAELGVDKEMNMEKLMEIDPEVVMAYTISGDYGQFRKMNQAGIPVLVNAEYMEDHPLGRAEWIKFMALFFDKSATADSVFDAIEKNYLDLKAKTDTITQKPTLYSGVVYQDVWYLPGGLNNAAKLFADAGGHYLWQDSTTGFIELSLESVYEKANTADYWVGMASFNNLEDIKDTDERYTQFRAYQQGQVYNYNARMGVTGGNEYLELGYLRPDLILADLIKILHPELMPEHELYFYKRLE